MPEYLAIGRQFLLAGNYQDAHRAYAEAYRLIRNTYKVLMTRGMRGTILYAADAETRAFLADHVHVQRRLETVYD